MSIQVCGEREFSLIERFWSQYRAAKGEPAMSADEREQLWREEVANPFQNGKGSCWIASDLGEPIAHLSRSPCPAYCDGRRIDAGWWRDLFAVGNVACGNATAALMLTVARLQAGHAVLGTPGVNSQVGKLYHALRFDYWGEVPFLYFVGDGAKFLRNVSVFKRNQVLFFLSNLASHLYIPGKLIELRHRSNSRLHKDIRSETWERFPAAADDLWMRLAGKFRLIFDRSTTYLNWRYAEASYRRVGFFMQDQLIGWVVWKLTAMSNNTYFGNMTVGTVVDILANPEKPAEVTAALRIAVDDLLAGGADLIVTNMSDPRLIEAARAVGFTPGPSNYHFFTKNLPALRIQDCHLTRGDSDGDRRL